MKPSHPQAGGSTGEAPSAEMWPRRGFLGPPANLHLRT